MSQTIPEVVMYSSNYCPFCFRAKSIFQEISIPIKELIVDMDSSLRQEMMQKAGRHTVPQIWIGDKHIGGCDELIAIQQSGELDKLLGINS